MDEKRPDQKNGRKDDTSEYSASKAPETRREAERSSSRGDSRLIPGGRRGADAEIGMSAMDRSDVPSGAEDTGLTRGEKRQSTGDA